MTMTNAVVLIEAERDALSSLGGALADIVRGPPTGVPEQTVANPRGPYLGADRGAFPLTRRVGDLASRRLHRRGPLSPAPNVSLGCEAHA